MFEVWHRDRTDARGWCLDNAEDTGIVDVNIRLIQAVRRPEAGDDVDCVAD